MYDKKYVESWIRNELSGKDYFRKKDIEPYLEKIVQATPSNKNILDVGCGWGAIIKHLKPTHNYYGVDKVPEFFEYIKENFSHPNIKLKQGYLPDNLNVPDDFFDVAICSMVLHLIENLPRSIKTLFSKIKSRGKLHIVDFGDSAEEVLKKSFFKEIQESRDNYLRGIARLLSGDEIPMEMYLHKEKTLEKEIAKKSDFIKIPLGDYFRAYECKKIY